MSRLSQNKCEIIDRTIREFGWRREPYTDIPPAFPARFGCVVFSVPGIDPSVLGMKADGVIFSLRRHPAYPGRPYILEACPVMNDGCPSDVTMTISVRTANDDDACIWGHGLGWKKSLELVRETLKRNRRISEFSDDGQELNFLENRMQLLERELQEAGELVMTAEKNLTTARRAHMNAEIKCGAARLKWSEKIRQITDNIKEETDE
jgi:hypothetical protein